MAEGGIAKKKPAPSFKIEFPGDQDVRKNLKDKIDCVKSTVKRNLGGKSVNNTELLNLILDFYMQHNGKGRQGPQITEHQFVSKEDTTQNMYLCSETSIKKLVAISGDHGRYCASELKVIKCTYSGHIGVAKLKCNRGSGAEHHYMWATSPKLPDGSYLGNHRINYGLIFSGIRPAKYERFVQGAGLGIIHGPKRREFRTLIKPYVQAGYNDSIQNAIALETTAALSANNDPAINIKTDARHGHRRNAKDTSVVALGEATNKVLCHIHVTKADDPVSQRHETLGTRKIYQFLDSKNVSVKIHTHDMSWGVTGFLKTRPEVTDQFEKWHGTKALKKNVSKVSKGPLRSMGSTWHPELEDKVQPMGTHAYYAIDKCNGDAEKLKSTLLNAVQHYKGDHDDCPLASRCNRDPNYEPSRVAITDKKAEDLLVSAIRKSSLYRHAAYFVHGTETAHVESFNNTMLMFHDKRSYCTDEEYSINSWIAVQHWNENVGRDHTSVWTPNAGQAGTRATKKRKIYKDPTYNYRHIVWDKYMHACFM